MRPERTISPQSWKEYWQTKDHREQSLGVDGLLHDTYKWIDSRSIKLYCMPQTKTTDLINVGRGVEQACKELGLDMRISYNDMCEDIEALDLEMQLCIEKNGGLDCQEFGRRLTDSYQRLNHAKVFITKQPLVPSILFGRSDYSIGYSVISLSRTSNRQQVARIAKHETYHLLGYPYEHETERVQGYLHGLECNMQEGSQKLETCEKCFDALQSFWKGIEERTGSKFFKQAA